MLAGGGAGRAKSRSYPPPVRNLPIGVGHLPQPGRRFGCSFFHHFGALDSGASWTLSCALRPPPASPALAAPVARSTDTALYPGPACHPPYRSREGRDVTLRGGAIERQSGL